MTKLNHTKAKWDIARFFCYALLTSCLFSRGVFMLYLTHKGLTVAQVGLYQMLVQLSMSPPVQSATRWEKFIPFKSGHCCCCSIAFS